MNKTYITTTIPYVNASPHIGHALEFVQADAYARYRRLAGDQVFLSSGSDENSLKNIQTAEKEGLPIHNVVNKYAEKIHQLAKALDVKIDVFNRTSSPKHFAAAQKFWQSCRPEDFYRKNYRGLYCVGCEAYYDQEELVDGKCPDHPTVPQEVEEENYFFRLSCYQEELEKLISSDRLKIIPEGRKNEMLSFVRAGLRDFSVSRSALRSGGWGVPVPNDKTQVMYVWFDALITYLTALDYGGEEKRFQEYWLGGGRKIHCLGKGVARFHAVYWPAMLLSAGLPLPDIEFVHGYLTIGGQKISKSLGNAVDPFALIDKYGAETLRYFLLKEVPSLADYDFSETKLKEVHNADLANGLGNLTARTAKLAERAGEIEPAPAAELADQKFASYRRSLEGFKLNEALQFVQAKISAIDKLIDRERPWEKTGSELKKFVTRLAAEILEISLLFKPFLPQTVAKLEENFRGPKIRSGPHLFSRIT